MQIFLNYLANKNLSKHSLKNYKSDLNHFASWIVLKVRSYGSLVNSLEDALPFLSRETASEYKEYLSENKIPLKTINRRLSTMRHLAEFLVKENLCDFNFMTGIENKRNQSINKEISLKPIVDDFKAFLEAEKVSSSTLKNYMSDINQFMDWLAKNPTYATSLT